MQQGLQLRRQVELVAVAEVVLTQRLVRGRGRVGVRVSVRVRVGVRVSLT